MSGRDEVALRGDAGASPSRRAGLVACVALALGCAPTAASFPCHDDSACVLAGAGAGRCESIGFCSFPDAACASGRRYRGASGGDVCVGTSPATCGGLRLNALHPDSAAPGDTLWLEGTFPAGSTVTFTGAGADVTVPPGHAAAHRISVVVPATAARGSVGVTHAGCASSRLPFEVVAAGRAPAGSFTSVAQMLPSDGQAVVSLGSRLASFGAALGVDSRAIDSATLSADGTVQPFAPAGALNVERKLPCALFVGDRLHVIGGHDGSQPLGSVESIAVSDFPGKIALATASLAQPRLGHACVVLGNYVYVLGGGTDLNNNDALASIERASFGDDGTLGPFSDAGIVLPSPRREFGAVVAGGFLYVFGGFDANNLLFRVERAAVGDDGTLQPFADWGPFTNDTNGVRERFATITIGRDVYLMGGFSSGLVLPNVMSAHIGVSDDLGLFADGSLQLVTPRQKAAACVSGGRAWIFGGEDSHDAAIPSLEWVSLR